MHAITPWFHTELSIPIKYVQSRGEDVPNLDLVDRISRRHEMISPILVDSNELVSLDCKSESAILPKRASKNVASTNPGGTDKLKVILYELFLRIRQTTERHLITESEFVGFAQRITVPAVPDEYVLRAERRYKPTLSVSELRGIFSLSSTGKMDFIEFEIAIGLSAAQLNIRLVYMYYLLGLSLGA